jgi:hypothetical protein
MEALKASVPTFQKISGNFTVSPELIALVDEIVAHRQGAADAVRQLAVLPGLLEIDGARIREAAREQLKERHFVSLFPAIAIHPDGKITHRADGADGHLDRHVALLVGAHLMIVEYLLQHFLVQVIDGIDERTLFDSLAEWPHLAERRQQLLAHASARFAARDWVSFGYIAATTFEAVLRDLLRALGYHALKLERDGTQMDETLNALLRGEHARKTLGEGFCALAEYVLCEPELGWNLRNEIAHGTVAAQHFSPSRMLLVWLLVVRVTCFVARSAVPGENAGDADGQAPPT